MKALVLFVFCTLITTSALAVSCPNNYYRMLCRGKFQTEYYPGTWGRDSAFYWLKPGFHMPTGAGERGQKLIPGTCAFHDRAVRINEPDRIRFFITTHNGYGGLEVITSCLSDKDCALEFCASTGSSDVGPVFHALENRLQMNYPNFSTNKD